MTNEELNTKLYEKLFDEQEAYKGWLLTQPPDEILKHAYEYTLREDIVLALEYMDLSSERAAALLESPSPLAELFKDFEEIETNHMDDVRDCIEKRADKEIEKQREALREFPVYLSSATFARENGELDIYRASHRANVDCKTAIEDAISRYYADNRLDTSACVQTVADRFGMERIAFVLASTVQTKDWDGRISDSNKEWAKGFPALGKHEYVCSQAHPGLINLFVNRFRKEQELIKAKKPSVLNKLKEVAAEATPKAPIKKKEVEL